MSSESYQVPQNDVEKVAEMAIEPSYVSEIARKLRKADESWAEVSEDTAVRRVAKIVNLLDDRMDMEVVEFGSDVEGQLESSPKTSFGPGGTMETEEWRDYKIIHNPDIDYGEVRKSYRGYVDTKVTLEDKLGMVAKVSGSGNDISIQAEEMAQDVLARQFREYDKVEFSDYNDPGIDFYVEDEGRRKWGLSIEISTRWVNPIDEPYLESKKDKAFDRDSDLIIMAPNIADNLLEKYEDPSEPPWHDYPESERIHLHVVPPQKPTTYRPFAMSVEDIVNETKRGSGNPILVPDSEKLREKIEESGNVSDSYPVVEDERSVLREVLTELRRDYQVVTESMYRNYIRESIEPLLWEFLRPYRIEQFLLDTYWDKGLTQKDIGRLVDRSGSTIGDWMMRWGVMRKGTGAPELSDEVREIWRRMYEGEEPFGEEFSGYRIKAEYNRHPLWDLDDWEQWYEDGDDSGRKSVSLENQSYRENLSYTVMAGASDRLLPSYTFIMKTLKEIGVEIREPDEAPRVPYSAYPSKGALEYMVNKNQETIVEVEGQE